MVPYKSLSCWKLERELKNSLRGLKVKRKKALSKDLDPQTRLYRKAYKGRVYHSKLATGASSSSMSDVNSTFETYDEIMKRIRASVRTQLKITSDVDSDQDDLGWEFDEASNASEEELIAFRQDLNPISENHVPPASEPDSLAVIEPVEPEAVIKTEKMLQDDFNEHLRSSQLLVDFQEKYIQRKLAQRNAGLDMARQTWHDTMASDPTFALEQLKEISMAAKEVSDQFETTNSIQELADDETPVVLSPSSKPFARFIPTNPVTLNNS